MEKQCKHCAMMIPGKAKICPYCQKPQGTSFVVKALIVFFMLGAFGSAIGNRAASQKAEPVPQSTEQKDKDMQDYLVRHAAIEFLKKQLKAPATADMPNEYELSVVPKANKKNTWVVTGTVDAQNSYGAKLRTNFRYTIHKDKDGGMSLIKSETN